MDFGRVFGPADHWLTLILLQRRFCENPAPVEAKRLFLRFRACKKRCKIKVKSTSKKAWKHTSQNVDFRDSPGPLGLLKIQGIFKVLAFGRPKNHQKLSKMLKMWILACALATWVLEGGLGEGFERILEGFLVDFEGCGPHC